MILVGLGWNLCAVFEIYLFEQIGDKIGSDKFFGGEKRLSQIYNWQRKFIWR